MFGNMRLGLGMSPPRPLSGHPLAAFAGDGVLVNVHDMSEEPYADGADALALRNLWSGPLETSDYASRYSSTSTTPAGNPVRHPQTLGLSGGHSAFVPKTTAATYPGIFELPSNVTLRNTCIIGIMYFPTGSDDHAARMPICSDLSGTSGAGNNIFFRGLSGTQAQCEFRVDGGANNVASLKYTGGAIPDNSLPPGYIQIGSWNTFILYSRVSGSDLDFELHINGEPTAATTSLTMGGAQTAYVSQLGYGYQFGNDLIPLDDTAYQVLATFALPTGTENIDLAGAAAWMATRVGEMTA